MGENEGPPLVQGVALHFPSNAHEVELWSGITELRWSLDCPADFCGAWTLAGTVICGDGKIVGFADGQIAYSS